MTRHQPPLIARIMNWACGYRPWDIDEWNEDRREQERQRLDNEEQELRIELLRRRHEEPMTTDPTTSPSPESQDVREALELQLFDLVELARDAQSDNGGEAKWVHLRGALVKEFAKRLRALAQSDARICLSCDLSGECHAFDSPKQVCELCEHHEPLTVEAVNRAFKTYENRKAQSDAESHALELSEREKMLDERKIK